MGLLFGFLGLQVVAALRISEDGSNAFIIIDIKLLSIMFLRSNKFQLDTFVRQVKENHLGQSIGFFFYTTLKFCVK